MKTFPPILYAEDNPNDVELTIAAFKECSLQNRMDIVTNGLEVLEYLRYEGKYKDRPRENPILILLDIKMPKLDGKETLKILKSDDKLKIIPVVMLSSSTMETDLFESYNLGANAYVVKPIDFDEFIDAVKKIGFFWALLNKAIT
jgi:CheY-like chemotaxis protein